MSKIRPNTITKLYGAQVNKYEFSAAKILVSIGEPLTFLPTRTVKTPDILFLGKEWEIKTPLGNSSRTIEDCLRRGSKQSPNIIIDIRFTKLPETKCLQAIRYHFHRIQQLKNILIITKSGKIIDISSNFEIIKE